MGTNVDKAVKMFVQTVKNANNRKTSPYDVTAKVVRVRGDTVYVHIDGGVDETPVKKTIDAKPGDKVKIRLSGGSGWITGNVTAPPTDDTKTDNFINNEFQYIFNKVENSEFGKGADGKDGKDGDPGPGVEKVEIVYCIADDDQLDEDGEPSMVTDDWQSNVPTIDDIPLDEMEEEADASEITDIISDKAYDLGGIVKTVNWVKINGTNFTDYTVEIETDEEGYKSSVIKFADGALPSTISSFVVNYIEGLDPEDIYYIWMRTLTYTTDMEEGDDPEEGIPSIYGVLTADGSDLNFKVRTIIREEKWFCLATAVAIGSGQTFEDIQHTEWSTTIPDIQQAITDYGDDLFYWSRVKYYYSDGTVAYSAPYYDFSAQIAYEVADAESSMDNHFWSDTSGAYVGHYEREKNQGHVLRAIGEGIILTKDGERMASFTSSGMMFRGQIGNQWTDMAWYTNSGIGFNKSVDYTIGDPAGQYIKWDSANNRIIICAQSIVYGSNNVDLATKLSDVESTANTAKSTANTANSTANSASSTASSANSTANSAYNKAVAAQNTANTTSNLIYMSGSGLYVVNSSDTSQKVLINSSGMNVYYSGTSVAQFGASTRIGYSDSWHIGLDNTKLSFYNSSGSSIGYIGTWQDTEDYLSGIQISSSLPALFLDANKVKILCGGNDNAFVVRCNNKKMIEYNYSSSSPYNRIRFPQAYHTGSASGKQAYINEHGWLNASSSKREIKTDITSEFTSENNPRNLYNVPVRQFKYKEGYIDPDDYNYGKDIVGIIAEEIDEAYPVGAYHEMDGTPGDWDIRTVVPAMLKLIQEQHEEIEAIKARLN